MAEWINAPVWKIRHNRFESQSGQCQWWLPVIISVGTSDGHFGGLVPNDAKLDNCTFTEVWWHENWHHYRPQRSCGKVMFLHLSVILSTGGCVYPSKHLGRLTPGQTPQVDTPRADTPQTDTHPQQMATVADGTHPTGMHSCFNCN